MEQYFTPIRRRLQQDPTTHGYTEVQLAVSIEAFLNHGWDWLHFRAFLTGDEGEMWKVLWITDNAFIRVVDESTTMESALLSHLTIQCATFTTPSGETHVLVLADVQDSEFLSAGAFSVFWHAVTTSNCVKLKLEHLPSFSGLCSGPALLHFLEASPSLKLLEFKGFFLEEAHCRALATLSRTGLEVTFYGCSFDPQGAEGTFIEWFRHNQVVTQLIFCTMEDSVIFALSGNSSVKRLLSTDGHGGKTSRSLAKALPGNQGIEYLYFFMTPSYHMFNLLLRSLWTHPRIQSMEIGCAYGLSPELIASMMNAVLRLVQCNTVVHTIDLPDNVKDEEFFQNFILPRLEMNRSCFEDQRQALTRAAPPIRGQLLGRALYVVRYNPDLLFRFLSENVTAFVRSDEDGPIIP
jgi:hypothetical protein